jgi:hypothetical protein
VISTITYCRRPLWLKLLQPLAVRWYAWRVGAEDDYTEQLRTGGVATAADLARRERNLAPLRTLFAWWQSA